MSTGNQPGFSGSGSMHSSGQSRGLNNTSDKGMAQLMGVQFGQAGFGRSESLMPASLRAMQGAFGGSEAKGPIGGPFSQEANTSRNNSFMQSDTSSSGFKFQSGIFNVGKSDPIFGRSLFSSGSFQGFNVSATQAASIGDGAWPSQGAAANSQALPIEKPLFGSATATDRPTSNISVFKALEQSQSSGTLYGSTIPANSNSAQPLPNYGHSVFSNAPSFGNLRLDTKHTVTPTNINAVPHATVPALQPGFFRTPQPQKVLDTQIPDIFVDAFEAPEFSLGKIPAEPPPAAFL